MDTLNVWKALRRNRWLVLPVLLLTVFGLIEFGMILFTNTQLHWATESAA